MDLQETILDNILKRFPKKSAAVKELADLLDTGQNAVYRRIRGESILTPREIALLARHYNICLLYTSPSPRDATLSRMPSSA